MLEENSRWTVPPRRGYEDRIEASLWLEQQDHHVLPSVGDVVLTGPPWPPLETVTGTWRDSYWLHLVEEVDVF